MCAPPSSVRMQYTQYYVNQFNRVRYSPGHTVIPSAAATFVCVSYI